MSKLVEVKRNALEVCRNCKGKGSVDGVRCELCLGSGMVKKTWEINITIEPYDPTKLNKERNGNKG